jgi:hypothetical protein
LLLDFEDVARIKWNHRAMLLINRGRHGRIMPCCWRSDKSLRKRRNGAAPVKIRAVQKITASVTAARRPEFRVSTPPETGGDF